MAHLLTTYKQDYINPNMMDTSKVSHNKKQNDCKCDEEAVNVDLVKMIENCGTKPGASEKSEWTGIAPMGVLIHPRIIPDREIENTQRDQHKPIGSCFQDKPNKFLNNLRNAYPDLYEKLKAMNHNDLQNLVTTNSLKSTYQIDYGNIAEYANGVYDDEEKATNKAFLNDSNGPNDPCALDNIIKVLESSGKVGCQLGVPKRTSICLKHCTGHWQIGPKINLKRTEYSDTISRIGGEIIKANIHDHEKCKIGNCKHPMRID